MYKQSPGRTQRSKGFKVKHALQICLLVAVCFWLIYQVKHSHHKKKGFSEHDAKISLDSVRMDNVVKFGRKDLHPLKESRVVETDKPEEVEEEKIEEVITVEEDENKHEAEDEKDERMVGGVVEEEVDEEVEEEITVEEENKHEEEEEEKTEVKDENGVLRKGLEEEVDDHDQEKSDREEDFVDEEKEQVNDDESDIGEEDNGSASDKHDNVGGTKNRHEAREDNYKADDASSAVTQITSNGNESVVFGKVNEQAGVNNVIPRDFSNHIHEGDVVQNAFVNMESEQTSNEGHLGTTNEQSETAISNSSVTDMSKDLKTVINSTEVRGEVQDVSQLNGNVTVLERNEEHSVTEEHKIDMEDLSGSKLSLEERMFELIWKLYRI